MMLLTTPSLVPGPPPFVLQFDNTCMEVEEWWKLPFFRFCVMGIKGGCLPLLLCNVVNLGRMLSGIKQALRQVLKDRSSPGILY